MLLFESRLPANKGRD